MHVELHWLANNNAVNVVTLNMDVKCLSPASQFGEGPGVVSYAFNVYLWYSTLRVYFWLYCLDDNNAAKAVAVGMG